MGDVCQTLFRRKPRKLPHWVNVSAEVGNCSRVPAEVSSGDRKSFSATPKDFFDYIPNGSFISESPDSFTTSSRLVVAILLNCGNMDTLRKGKP